MKKILFFAVAAMMLISLTLSGCGNNSASNDTDSTSALVEETQNTSTSIAESNSAADSTQDATIATEDNSTTNVLSSIEGSILDTSELFTDRDLEQSADLTGAVYIELSSSEDVTIAEEGVYVLCGEAKDVTVVIKADDEAKVQIVLDGVRIENEDAPAIYVQSADKVFVTTTDSDNVLEVTGTYEADGNINLDAVVFSKSDLVLSGVGTLEIISVEGNGITSKDDLKITGGTYSITSLLDSLEANDSILVSGGDITIVTDKDGLHSENEEDSSLGYIYILNGELNITASDVAIQGTSIVQVDGGVINIETCREGIEGTYVQINGGEISIYATDDGLNASAKSDTDVVIEINGGTIDISMASGDTDAVDSNGSITIQGGTINITANSAFDSDGSAQLISGTVTVNGQLISQITQSQIGGGGGGKKR